ncbi:MAG: zinc ABC transporter substrate-binding protein AztC [Mycetocola sp.]
MRRASQRRRTVVGYGVAAVALTVALAGCGAQGGDASSDGPTVVVSTNILGDVVEQIAGDQVQVTTLMKPDADPHSFEISAREAQALDSADLIISNGLGLEEGLGQHLDQAAQSGVPLLAVGEHVDPIVYGSSAGDSAGQDDPHFWTDPVRMDTAVAVMTEALAEVDGINAEQLTASSEAYRGELSELDTEMRAAFDRIPDGRRALVTNHHVFAYLAERYDFRVLGAVLPSGTTLAAPSASDLAELAGVITEAGVPTIFADSSQPDRLVQVLAEEADVEVAVVSLFTESLSAAQPGAGSYLEMMRSNTKRISDGLAGATREN